MKPLPEGLLLLDKPAGPTSHDVVERVRRITGQYRVGHAGTLDPLATGLLPLVLGRATRLVRFLPRSPKVYEGEVHLGITTDTDDITGSVLSRHAGPMPETEQVLEAALRLGGRQTQRPPTISARKVGGERLYRLAREGRYADPLPAEVVVSRFELRPTEDPADWRFLAEVSGGTYIRALARDLGASLGCGGVLKSLRRLAIGPLRLEEALPFPGRAAPDVDSLFAALIPLALMPLDPPPARLADVASSTRFRAGVAVPAPPDAPRAGACRVLDVGGELLGIAEVYGAELRPRVVLPPLASSTAQA